MSTLPPIPQQAPMTNENGTPTSIWSAFFRQMLAFMSSNVTSYPISISNGGTGQTTAQSALDGLIGTQGAGKYMRSNGTNTTLQTIQAGDVPTLNQSTTGTASNVTGTVAIANGGTGQTTANAALNALLPTQTGNSGKYLTTDGSNSSWGTVSASGIPAGAVIAYGAASAPSGWLLCDGSAVSRTTYAALFSAIGTTYGVGDGSTTFNVPNGQGVFLRGAGSQTIGGISYSGTLGTAQGDQMQGHFHSIPPYLPSGGSGSSVNFNAGSLTTIVTQTGSPTTDGSHGTPRTGSETRPANLGITWIIKT